MPGGLPVGYGKANNPTGKGGFEPGHSGYDNGKAKSAGRRLNEALGAAVMENDSAALKANMKALMGRFKMADEWATEFVFNRLCGRPAQAITLAGEGEGSDPIRHIVEFVIVDPVARST